MFCVLAVLLFVKLTVVRGTFQPCERQFCAIYTSPSTQPPFGLSTRRAFQRWTCVRFANALRQPRKVGSLHVVVHKRRRGTGSGQEKQKLQVREIARSTTSFPRPNVVPPTTHLAAPGCVTHKITYTSAIDRQLSGMWTKTPPTRKVEKKRRKKGDFLLATQKCS